MNLEFYRGKRVFVTGHTGFKGSWICRMLVGAGAVVTGYSLEPPTTPNLFSLAGLEGKMTSVIGDIRDFANDRIIPDCVRAMAKGESIGVRNPYSTRPYQHVLEPLAAYLLIAQRQYEDNRYAGYYNVGPDDCDCVTTGTLVDLFCQAWGDGAAWENRAEANAPHEANFLKLDCSKLKSTFGWKPRWHMAECMQKTVAFSKVWLSGGDIPAEMDKEIKEFLSE